MSCRQKERCHRAHSRPGRSRKVSWRRRVVLSLLQEALVLAQKLAVREILGLAQAPWSCAASRRPPTPGSPPGPLPLSSAGAACARGRGRRYHAWPAAQSQRQPSRARASAQPSPIARKAAQAHPQAWAPDALGRRGRGHCKDGAVTFRLFCARLRASIARRRPALQAGGLGGPWPAAGAGPSTPLGARRASGHSLVRQDPLSIGLLLRRRVGTFGLCRSARAGAQRRWSSPSLDGAPS